jgi:hypothetical protein
MFLLNISFLESYIYTKRILAVERIDISVRIGIGYRFGIEIFLQPAPFKEIVATDINTNTVQVRLLSPTGR